MILIEKTEVSGWEAAIRGMRNPMNSWDKSDSEDGCTFHGNTNFCLNGCGEWYECYGANASLIIGPNDLKLMKQLVNAGTDHRKFMRMIVVYCDITAPLYWWKEFDTYKVGTVANSCSTMHKIHAKEFVPSDFSTERLCSCEGYNALNLVIDTLNLDRDKFLRTKKKEYWDEMIQTLPTSYNQKRTVMLNYEVLSNIYKSRKNHKLEEWHEMCRWIELLPYSGLITGKEGEADG